MLKNLILSIETSCDETALALVEVFGTASNPQFRVKKSCISSQIAIHRPFGGVVPNLAKREHLKNLPVLFQHIVPQPKKLKLTTIAVTVGPGLEPALWTGIEFAKQIRAEHFPDVPLVGVNHLEGHLLSFLLSPQYRTRGMRALFPAVGLIASGGHTTLLSVQSLTRWKKLGETRDDAVGECFDKTARLLSLPYPGGPEIEKLARSGNPLAVPFPRPMLYDNSPNGKFNFSFSGLKTAVLYHLRDNPNAHHADVAASFQESAIDVLTTKTMHAASETNARSVLLSGGVAANQRLRTSFAVVCKKHGVAFAPTPIRYNTDNAVMIAVAVWVGLRRKKRYPLTANGCLEI